MSLTEKVMWSMIPRSVRTSEQAGQLTTRSHLHRARASKPRSLAHHDRWSTMPMYHPAPANVPDRSRGSAIRGPLPDQWAKSVVLPPICDRPPLSSNCVAQLQDPRPGRPALPDPCHGGLGGSSDGLPGMLKLASIWGEGITDPHETLAMHEAA